MSAIREQFFKNWEEHGPRDAERKAAQRPPEGVGAVRDVPYRNLTEQQELCCTEETVFDQRDFLLDIFFPEHFEEMMCCSEHFEKALVSEEHSESTLPIIIDVHGGGWVYGNKELNEYYCMELAKLGFLVFDINYRLAPKTDLKGQVQDVVSALNWVFRHAQQYQGDLNRVYLTGDSAGAQLALLTCGAASNEEYRKVYEIPELTGTIQALGLTCPVPCLHEMCRSEDPMQQVWMQVVYGMECQQSPIWNYSDPEDYLSECSFPTVYILTTRGDANYYWQSEKLHHLLKEREIEHAYRVWEPTGEEECRGVLGHVFNVLYPEYGDSRKANREMTNFFLKKGKINLPQV